MKLKGEKGEQVGVSYLGATSVVHAAAATAHVKPTPRLCTRMNEHKIMDLTCPFESTELPVRATRQAPAGCFSQVLSSAGLRDTPERHKDSLEPLLRCLGYLARANPKSQFSHHAISETRYKNTESNQVSLLTKDPHGPMTLLSYRATWQPRPALPEIYS